jgi:flagellar basal body-associated protein FliL
MSTETEEPMKPGTSKLSIIILGVGIAALAGGGAMMMARPSGAKEKPAKHASGDHGEAGDHGDAAAEEEEAGTDEEESGGGEHGKAGAIAKLEPFIANLASTDSEMHYIKCTLAAEIANEHAQAEIEKRVPRIRQDVILYLSSLTLAETNGGENKKKIHQALEATVQKVVGKKNAKHVYITEFVIQ